jgi:hypothetical protein
MITLQEVQKKAQAHYENMVKLRLQGQMVVEPLTITRAGDTGIMSATREKTLDELISNQKSDRKPFSYVLITEKPKPRARSTETRIKAIEFGSNLDLIHFLGHVDQFESLDINQQLTQQEAPHLINWCAEHVSEFIKHTQKWPQLIEIVRLFKDNPQPKIPLRLLDLKMSHTKFIEENNAILCKLIDLTIPTEHINYSDRSFTKRYQLLDYQPFVLCASNDPILHLAFGGYTHLSLPLDQLAQRPLPAARIIVVENKASIHQLLAHDLPNTFVIFGTGYAAEILGQLQWLHHKNVFYWGDLDTFGLDIYNKFKQHFPHTRALMMDTATLMAHKEYHKKSKLFSRPVPPHLSTEEKQLFLDLETHQILLEQEKIHEKWVKDALLQLD